MSRLVLSRLAQALVCVLVVSLIVFVLTRLTGSPVHLLLGEMATHEDIIALERELGLDKPIAEQYAVFLSRAVQGDFGRSITARRPAIEVVLERFPATLELTMVTMSISLLLGTVIGVYSAVRRGTSLDSAGRLFAIFGQSIPVFWLGIMLIWIFAVWLPVLPSTGREGIKSLILPAITLGWFNAAAIMRLTRSSMLNVLDSEYVKLARVKGLSERVVIWKHAYKNAVSPVLTYTAMLFVISLGGAIATETVFAWPGVGRLVMDAISRRDFPVIQAAIMLLSVGYIVVNLIVDLLYVYLNPKIELR